MAEGMYFVVNVMLSLISVMNQPSALCTHGGEVMYFGCVCFRGEFGFLNCGGVGCVDGEWVGVWTRVWSVEVLCLCEL